MPFRIPTLETRFESVRNQAIDLNELPPLPEAHANINHFFTQEAMFSIMLYPKGPSSRRFDATPPTSQKVGLAV